MRRRVFYLMSHAAHLPYLVVSLRSLRNWWDGDVWVYAWPESIEVVREIANDHSLGIRACYSYPFYRGKNDQFLHKQTLPSRMGDSVDSCLYLDADTIISGDLTELFVVAEDCGFAATQFNDWTLGSSGIVTNRVKRLLDMKDPILPEVVKSCLKSGMKSVNGGVWACRPGSLVLPMWQEWTYAARDIFIADETVLHPVAMYSEALGRLKIVHGYNTSPVEKYQDIPDESVRVRHFHGDSNVRPSKSQRGFDLWWLEFESCKRDNVGSMGEWIGQIRNKHLNAIEGWDG